MFLSAFIRFGNTAKLERFFDDVKRFSSVMFTFSTLTFDRFFFGLQSVDLQWLCDLLLVMALGVRFFIFRRSLDARKALRGRSVFVRFLCAGERGLPACR